MSERSKGDVSPASTSLLSSRINNNRVVQNPLLSASVTGLSFDDFPNKPQLLPAAPPVVQAPPPQPTPVLIASILNREPKSLVTVGQPSSIDDTETLDEINLNPSSEESTTNLAASNFYQSTGGDANANPLLEPPPVSEVGDSLLSQAASSFTALPAVASNVFSTFSKRIYSGSTSRERTPQSDVDELQPQLSIQPPYTQQGSFPPAATAAPPLPFYAAPPPPATVGVEALPAEPPKFYAPAEIPALPTVPSVPPPTSAGGQNTYRFTARKKLYAPIPGLSGQQEQQQHQQLPPQVPVPFTQDLTQAQPPPPLPTSYFGASEPAPQEQEPKASGGLFSLTNLVPTGVLQNISGLVQSATGQKVTSNEPSPYNPSDPTPGSYIGSTQLIPSPTNFFAPPSGTDPPVGGYIVPGQSPSSSSPLPPPSASFATPPPDVASVVPPPLAQHPPTATGTASSYRLQKGTRLYKSPLSAQETAPIQPVAPVGEVAPIFNPFGSETINPGSTFFTPSAVAPINIPIAAAPEVQSFPAFNLPQESTQQNTVGLFAPPPINETPVVNSGLVDNQGIALFAPPPSINPVPSTQSFFAPQQIPEPVPQPSTAPTQTVDPLSTLGIPLAATPGVPSFSAFNSPQESTKPNTVGLFAPTPINETPVVNSGIAQTQGIALFAPPPSIDPVTSTQSFFVPQPILTTEPQPIATAKDTTDPPGIPLAAAPEVVPINLSQESVQQNTLGLFAPPLPVNSGIGDNQGIALFAPPPLINPVTSTQSFFVPQPVPELVPTAESQPIAVNPGIPIAAAPEVVPINLSQESVQQNTLGLFETPVVNSGIADNQGIALFAPPPSINAVTSTQSFFVPQPIATTEPQQIAATTAIQPLLSFPPQAETSTEISGAALFASVPDSSANPLFATPNVSIFYPTTPIIVKSTSTTAALFTPISSVTEAPKEIEDQSAPDKLELQEPPLFAAPSSAATQIDSTIFAAKTPSAPPFEPNTGASVVPESSSSLAPPPQVAVVAPPASVPEIFAPPPTSASALTENSAASLFQAPRIPSPFDSITTTAKQQQQQEQPTASELNNPFGAIDRTLQQQPIGFFAPIAQPDPIAQTIEPVLDTELPKAAELPPPQPKDAVNIGQANPFRRSTEQSTNFFTSEPVVPTNILFPQLPIQTGIAPPPLAQEPPPPQPPSEAAVISSPESLLTDSIAPPPLGFDQLLNTQQTQQATINQDNLNQNSSGNTFFGFFGNSSIDQTIAPPPISSSLTSLPLQTHQVTNSANFFDNFEPQQNQSKTQLGDILATPNHEQTTNTQQNNTANEDQRIQNFFNNPPLQEQPAGPGDLKYDIVHSGLAVRNLQARSQTPISNLVEPPSSACSEFSELSGTPQRQQIPPPAQAQAAAAATSSPPSSYTPPHGSDRSGADLLQQHYADLPEEILQKLRMANVGTTNSEKGPALTPPQPIIYTSVVRHWFFKRSVGEKFIWTPFSHYDSALLETSLSSDNESDIIVAVEGGRYDVNIKERTKTPVYWEGKSMEVRRCSWFYKGVDSKYIPYEEATAQLLETEYKQAAETGVWHKKIVLDGGEQVVFHGPTVIVHFHPQQNADNWGTSTQSTMRPRVVKRDLDDFKIEQGESQHVDHLLFMVHGVGSACDLRMRDLEEVVDDFRNIAQQLVQSHYKNSTDLGLVGRVEVLPISWHSHLHSEELGIDEKLKSITLESIPRLRNFTNDTLLDVLFYTSPMYCQKIMNTVATSLNEVYLKYRARHPDFNGGVSVAGHSLGSLILFDLLCHQEPLKESEEENMENPDQLPPNDSATCKQVQLPCAPSDMQLPKQVSYTIGPAGTGQPVISYTQLIFHPKKFFALGSPIGMFVTIRGIDKLGLDFRLPTCAGFYNIFHPFDPVAYRIEALVNPDMSGIRPVLIPHHKGRKRMHLELKETMTRVGADIKQKFMDTFKTTLDSVNFLATVTKVKKEAEESLEKEVMQRQIDDQEESSIASTSKQAARSRLNSDSTTASDPEFIELDFPLGKLNDSKRIDYVLQEAPLEFINEYIFALSSHVCYWESEDTILFVMKEIYAGLGISTDSQVPQQTMTIERPTQQLFPM